MAEYDGPPQAPTPQPRTPHPLPPGPCYLHPLPPSSSTNTSTYRAPSTFYDGPRRTSAPQLHREDGMAHAVNSGPRRLTLPELHIAAAAHLHPLASLHDTDAAACPCHPTLVDSSCRLHGPALPTKWQWPYLQQGCTSLGQSVEVYEEFLEMGYSPSQQQRYWLDNILTVYFDSPRDDRPGLLPAHAGLRLISGILHVVRLEASWSVNLMQGELDSQWRTSRRRNYLVPLLQPGSTHDEQAPEEVFESDALDPLEGARFWIGSIMDRAASQVPGAAISCGPHITDAPLTHAEMDRLQALGSTDWIAGMVPYAAFWDWLRTRSSALSLHFFVMTWWPSDEVGKIRLIILFFPHLVEQMRAAMARSQDASVRLGTQRRRRSASPLSRRVAARLGDGVAAHHPAQSQGTASWLDMASAPPPPPPPPFSQEPATLIPGPHQVQHVRAHFGTSYSSPHDADQQSQSQHAPPSHQARPRRSRTLTSAGSRLQAVAQGSATPQETASPYTPQAAASPPAHLLPRPHAPAHRYTPQPPPPAWPREQHYAPLRHGTMLSPQAPSFAPQQPLAHPPQRDGHAHHALLHRPAELNRPLPPSLQPQPVAHQTRGRRGLTISELPPNVTTSFDSMPVAAQPFAYMPPGHEPTMGLGLTFPVHQQGAQPSTYHIAPAPPPPQPPLQGTAEPLPSTSSGAGNAVPSPGSMDIATTLLSLNPSQQQQLAGRPATAPSALARAGIAEAVTAHRVGQRGGRAAAEGTAVAAGTPPAVPQASPAQQSTLPPFSLPPLPTQSSEPWPPSILAPALSPAPAAVPATSTLPPRPSLAATQPLHETHGLPSFAFASGSNRASMPQPPWRESRVRAHQRVVEEDAWTRERRERAAARARADAVHASRVGGTLRSHHETMAPPPVPSGSSVPFPSAQDVETEESQAQEALEGANAQAMRPADHPEAVARARALLGQVSLIESNDDESEVDHAPALVPPVDADAEPEIQTLARSSGPSITLEASTPPDALQAPSPPRMTPLHRQQREEMLAERRRSLPGFACPLRRAQSYLAEEIQRERDQLRRPNPASWSEEDYYDLSLRMPASFGDSSLFPEVPAPPRMRRRTMEVAPRRRGDLPGAPLPRGSPPLVSSDAGDDYPGETADRQREDAEDRIERRFANGDEIDEVLKKAERRREG